MKRFFFISATIASTILITSCNKQEKTETNKTDTETIAKESDEIITQNLTDKAGNKLDLVFNNTKDNVTFTIEGETVELPSQKPASGIWYKNEHYELRGKGESVTLTKDGKTIFEN